MCSNTLSSCSVLHMLRSWNKSFGELETLLVTILSPETALLQVVLLNKLHKYSITLSQALRSCEMHHGRSRTFAEVDHLLPMNTSEEQFHHWSKCWLKTTTRTSLLISVGLFLTFLTASKVEYKNSLIFASWLSSLSWWIMTTLPLSFHVSERSVTSSQETTRKLKWQSKQTSCLLWTVYLPIPRRRWERKLAGCFRTSLQALNSSFKCASTSELLKN